MPAISVVMSVYNGERYLAEAMDSILGQTFADFEFVIVDDGSKDSTAEILGAYARRDARVRVITQENTGRSEALNRGFAAAKAPLIARMDADDISLPQRLQQQVEFMRQHSEVGLLGGQCERITEGSRQRIPWLVFHTEDADIRAGLPRAYPVTHGTAVLRKDLVLRLGGFRKALPEAEDNDLFLRMAEHTRLANLAETVLLYRIHASQGSIRNMRLQVECGLAATAAAEMRMRGLPDPLAEISEVSPEFLVSLGITEEEIRRELLNRCRYLMESLQSADSDFALQVIDYCVGLCDASGADATTAADALMRAARICYRRRQFGRALGYMSCSVLTRPSVAGRHLRMAGRRRLRGGSAPGEQTGSSV